jgi:hypothetical protein
VRPGARPARVTAGATEAHRLLDREHPLAGEDKRGDCRTSPHSRSRWSEGGRSDDGFSPNA